MLKLRKIFLESFYGALDKNCVLEFTYPQLKQVDIEQLVKKFGELLHKIEVPYNANYLNISKVVVICKEDKIEDVKSIAKSLGLTFQNELRSSPQESSHI
jgi:hypothetical protein